jgi:hypothetical protein
MVAIPVNMGTHHTIPYSEKTRIRESLKRKSAMFHGLVIRKNIRNKKGILLLFVEQCGLIYGLIYYVFIISLAFFSLKITSVAAISIMILDLLYGLFGGKQLYYRMITHYICPFYVARGIIAGTYRKKDCKVGKTERETHDSNYVEGIYEAGLV